MIHFILNNYSNEGTIHPWLPSRVARKGNMTMEERGASREPCPTGGLGSLAKEKPAEGGGSLDAAVERIAALARSAFRSAEQYPCGSYERRFIEHGGMCYFNCWSQLQALISTSSPAALVIPMEQPNASRDASFPANGPILQADSLAPEISEEMERAGVDVMWADRPDLPRGEVARDVFVDMLQVVLESPDLRHKYLVLLSQ